MRPRVLFYVQHLLGIGHLVRAGRVAAALAEGLEVLLVVGGNLPPDVVPRHVPLLHLPPVRAGENGFGTLVHPDGRLFEGADKDRRRDLLIGAFDRFRPDILLIEAFPFGRRTMRFELLPLLERAKAATPRPLIACSVRDILQDTRPERQAETTALVRRFFDLVLVHGDPALFPLERSFPLAAAFENQVRYTGMVGPASPSLDGPEREGFDVIVSVGGGAVGAGLVACALDARPRTSLRDASWLVLTGPNLRHDGAIRQAEGVTIRAFEPGLPALLRRARVSVSQAGYNTVADLAAARCRAVLVPFARGGETEQTCRAALLDERGWAVALAERDLDPASLAAGIEQALALPAPGPDLRLDGAERTRSILVEAVERHLSYGGVPTAAPV